jgi:hypothetical protein
MEDITGRKYGKLTVMKLHKVERTKKSGGFGYGYARYWLCQCICGGKIIVQQSILTAGRTSMCKGCRTKYDAKRKPSDPNKQIKLLDLDTMDRSTPKGVIKYFSMRTILFVDTFGVPYSESTAAEEFNKITTYTGGNQNDGI